MDDFLPFFFHHENSYVSISRTAITLTLDTSTHVYMYTHTCIHSTHALRSGKNILDIPPRAPSHPHFIKMTHTTHASRRGGRDILQIPLRHPNFTKMTYTTHASRRGGRNISDIPVSRPHFTKMTHTNHASQKGGRETSQIFL
jgi:hypothetical protein